MIETRKAVSNLDDILSVKGIDAGVIGSSDLSLSFGCYPPQFGNSKYELAHPQYMDAFDKVVAVAKKWGKPVGMPTSAETFQWAIEKGFTLNTVGSADVFLMQGAGIALEKAHEALSKARQI